MLTRKLVPLSLLAIGAIVGCDQPIVTNTPNTATTPTNVAPDNTAVNERDRADNAKTPINQDENQADVTITAEIRKEVVAQPDFSLNAQNVKIITSQGKVTLRGPVNSDQERDTVVAIAKKIAGDDKVDNQLEVVPPK